jgi:hypothetical protein
MLSTVLVGARPAEARPDPAAIAVDYLRGHAAGLGLTAADVAEVTISDQVRSADSGVTHVYLLQHQQGVAVVNGIVNVSIGAGGQVLDVGNRFVANLAAATAGQSAAPSRSAAAAVQSAASELNLGAGHGLTVLESPSGANRQTSLAGGDVSAADIPAELVWQPLDDGSVRLAWSLVIEPADTEHVWSATVDAANGTVLQTVDLVVHDDIASVAAATARPTAAAAVVGPPETVDDGSSYRVFPIPLESPSDGERALVQNPASAEASPFGWHDTDGAAGPESTRTHGNNVDAYADRDNDNLPDPGTDPDGGAGLDFDFPLDLGRRPLDSRDAAVTNLFYWNNIIHDVLYGYGFDEASGNFQVNDYGRGGAGADAVRAEAQDGSGRNNANFFTPVDGQRPRMQMFEWRSSAPNPIVVAPPSPIAGTYFGPMAGFGESLVTTGPISGEVVYVGRGCDPAYQAGQPLDPYLADPEGKIALIDRGSCTFVAKVKKAQDEGALMVIVANNAPGPAIAMGGADPTITIPSVMVTQSDGNLFRANAPFDATISDGTGGVPDRDSDFDAGVISHEYGHGVSNRLTGGPSNVTCLQNNEQMGEGWSDFYGLSFTSAPGDTPAGPRGIGTYVNFQSPEQGGIRPRPYTTDLSVNEYTYAMIPAGLASGELTIPHGIGFVWNSMLWEVYWALVEAHGYNPNVYDDWTTGGNNLAIQLVTDGMKFQPCSPGFVDGRDGILAADRALTGGANQCAIWWGFAKRGLGFGASQGSSNDVLDGVAAFDLPTECGPRFQNPVAPPPSVNEANAGTTVPVRFTLTQHSSDPITSVDALSQQVDCATLAPTGALEPASGFWRQRTFPRYRFEWRTLPSWEGTCRQFVLRIGNIVDQVAYFHFR